MIGSTNCLLTFFIKKFTKNRIVEQDKCMHSPRIDLGQIRMIIRSESDDIFDYQQTQKIPIRLSCV